jgi:hypothetical protein
MFTNVSEGFTASIVMVADSGSKQSSGCYLFGILFDPEDGSNTFL